jgi:hypothetical protein
MIAVYGSLELLSRSAKSHGAVRQSQPAPLALTHSRKSHHLHILYSSRLSSETSASSSSQLEILRILF